MTKFCGRPLWMSLLKVDNIFFLGFVMLTIKTVSETTELTNFVDQQHDLMLITLDI